MVLVNSGSFIAEKTPILAAMRNITREITRGLREK
jgi:hypothetical protein